VPESGGHTVSTGEREPVARFAWSARAADLGLYLPAGLTVLYLVLLAAAFRPVVQAIFLNADIVSGPYIGELLGEAPPDAEVVLGNFPWYQLFWFEALTDDLGPRRVLWQAGPYVGSLAGVAFVAWSAWKAAGRWAGVMVATVLVAASPPLLTLQFSWTAHAATWIHVCLLGAFLVACASRGGMLGGPLLHTVAGTALALVTAAGVASDQLLVPAGVVPFFLAGLGLAVVLPAGARAALAVTVAVVTTAALVGGEIIVALMEDAGVRATEFPIKLATYDRIFPNARLFLQSLAYLFNGDFGGLSPGFEAVLALACSAAVLVGLAAAVRSVPGFVRVQLAARGTARTQRDAARVAHLGFWLLAGLILTVAFVLSSVPVDRESSRYIVGVAYALAAVLPVLAFGAERWARPAVALGVCVVVAGSLAALIRKDVEENPSRFPTGLVSGPLAELVEVERLDHGYGDYWDAAALTWQSKAVAKVYPVTRCGDDLSHYCPFPYHRISTWYEPRPGTRSFLVVDKTQPSVHQPDPRFGEPERVVGIGQLEVHVYDYDIATRLGP
jgi:cytochrome b561